MVLGRLYGRLGLAASMLMSSLDGSIPGCQPGSASFTWNTIAAPIPARAGPNRLIAPPNCCTDGKPLRLAADTNVLLDLADGWRTYLTRSRSLNNACRTRNGWYRRACSMNWHI